MLLKILFFILFMFLLFSDLKIIKQKIKDKLKQFKN